MMKPEVYRVLLYYVVPSILLSTTVLVIYSVLSTPLGWYVIPGIAGLAAWLRYRDNDNYKINNADR